MRYCFLVILSINIAVYAHANANNVKVDSLLKVWNNKQLADTTRIKAIKQLSWECYAFTNTDTAEIYARMGYALAKQKNNTKYMSVMLNTLGSVYALKGEFGESIKLYHEALAIQQKTNDHYGVAKTYNNIGYIYRNQNNFTAALDYQLKSIAMQEKYNLKDFKLITLVNIGITYQELNDYNLAIKYYLKGLKIAEEAKDAVQITDIQNNIGLIYIDQNDYVKALKLYQKNFEIYEKANNKLGLAMSFLNIGVCYVHMNNRDSALANYAKALSYFEQLDDKPHIIKTLNNIGIIHQKNQDFNDALYYFQKSLSMSKGMDSKKDIAASLGNIGYIFKQQNKLAEAKQYYEQSFEIAQQSGSIDEISNSASFLWDYYKATHQFEKSLRMFEIYVQTKDSISNDIKQKEMLKASMKFMYEKKATADSVNTAKQIEIKNVELNKQRIQIKAKRNEQIALILGLALVIIFSGFLYNRFRLIQHQKVIIENAHQSLAIKSKEVLDSINYSKRIQTAILPPERMVKEYLQDSFILYLPKDIVAGDFYWMEKIGNKIFVAACDCTGHGVPGALVSVVCNNALNRAVHEFGERLPGKIFDKTRALVLESFAKSDEEVKDGMDASLAVFDMEQFHQKTPDENSHLKSIKLEWAVANNPLWIIRNTNGNAELIEIKADKQPIGKGDENKPFNTHQINLMKGDTVYLFTDGFADQFGTYENNKVKKMTKARYRELLLSISNLPMQEQHKKLLTFYENFKGNLEQIDDVCIIGVRV